MGSFQGHILPGTFFLIFGIRTLYKLLERYYLCRKVSLVTSSTKDVVKYQFRSTLTYRSAVCPALPFEEIGVLCSSLLGTLGEVITGFDSSGHFITTNGHHVTMYLFFGIASFLVLLQHYRYPVPANCDYACTCLAFGMEGLLFYNHLHGRHHMDIQVHLFLVYTIFLNTAAMLSEMLNRQSVLAAVARAYFTVLQGSWFYQIGFILYPPFGKTWDVDDHGQMMLVTIIFAWHFACVIVMVGLLATVAHLRVRMLAPHQVIARLENDFGFMKAQKLFKKHENSDYMIMISDEENE
ncbi:Protein of unknown function DUF716 (TMEM45) [Trinorchestia longiramus]|nr:Protein of unknown function DUF716 (TMEM45) [Trinorchestia longiramus]